MTGRNGTGRLLRLRTLAAAQGAGRPRQCVKRGVRVEDTLPDVECAREDAEVGDGAERLACGHRVAHRQDGGGGGKGGQLPGLLAVHVERGLASGRHHHHVVPRGRREVIHREPTSHELLPLPLEAPEEPRPTVGAGVDAGHPVPVYALHQRLEAVPVSPRARTRAVEPGKRSTSRLVRAGPPQRTAAAVHSPHADAVLLGEGRALPTQDDGAVRAEGGAPLASGADLLQAAS